MTLPLIPLLIFLQGKNPKWSARGATCLLPPPLYMKTRTLVAQECSAVNRDVWPRCPVKKGLALAASSAISRAFTWQYFQGSFSRTEPLHSMSHFSQCCLCVLSCVQLFVTPWTVSSVQGISQARILGQTVISHSRGSFQQRDQTRVSCVSCDGRQILYHCTTWESQCGLYLITN